MKNKIIVVIHGGALQDVFASNPDTEVCLLDYDNMEQTEENSEEYAEYLEFEKEIKTQNLHQVW